MTNAVDHYDLLLAEHFSWMLGDDIPGSATQQARLLRDLGVIPVSPNGTEATAVDLGCGPGTQTLALTALGFTRVLAVDTNAALLEELTAHTNGDPAATAAVRTVHADLRTALPQLTEPGTVDAVVCMGDTLTHLPARSDVTAVLEDAATALAPGGNLVITYRDLTRPLEGTDRFLPVRSTENKLITCFLEYADEETVTVHDLVHLRSGNGWEMHAGSYPKLRLGTDWLEGQCRSAGLTVRRSAPGARGLHVLHAVRGSA
ncbi:class I SAM-dependent methyltransferase [Streptomyces sp. N2-109]|uniref:Class I SAM-dependent methyltransferase n=1 Tax=Streptomyces gossypii TaxID=2883101 RepID=A0ABT2K2N9_9ACTN|nr:class I SAM-dependent methyltransferase [Streptomyces gossypii]MCT2594422.1 class I SAM-dependent methyltransferase [Streptomyces gossypii]